LEAVKVMADANRGLTGKKVIVTAGLTIEHLDSARDVKNRSSGKMGIAVTEEALERGATVTLIYGSGTVDPPSNAKVIRVVSTKEMFNAVVSELTSEICDILIATAVADIWGPQRLINTNTSTDTAQGSEMKLRPPLIVDVVKKLSPKTFLVAFRAERGLSNDELIESAYKRLKAANADLVSINDTGREGVGFGVDTNEEFIVDPAKNVTYIPLASKREVAQKLLDLIEKKLDK
jgi:phosphopantothenoylcysteine decarboxylase/phosphopantothenate--cysteine ligase